MVSTFQAPALVDSVNYNLFNHNYKLWRTLHKAVTLFVVEAFGKKARGILSRQNVRGLFADTGRLLKILAGAKLEQSKQVCSWLIVTANWLP